MSEQSQSKTDPEIIEVLCFVFPDATVYWAAASEMSPERIAGVIANWRDRAPSKIKLACEAGANGGFVRVRMSLDAYRSIPATSESAALFSERTSP